jgi:hypothetical protein
MSLKWSSPKTSMNKHPEGKKEAAHTSRPMITVEDREHNVDEYSEYNENINNHCEYIQKFTPRDNHALVRLFKYEDFAKTDGGIIIDNDTEFIKDSTGQMIARRSNNPYQYRGVIVKMGHVDSANNFHSKLIPGTIVRTLSNKLGSEFDTDPYTKGVDEQGYFLVHIGQFCGIEEK